MNTKPALPAPCFFRYRRIGRPAAFPSAASLDEVAALPVVTVQNAFVIGAGWRAALAQGRTELAAALGKAVRRGVVARAIGPWTSKAGNARRQLQRVTVRPTIHRTA